MTTYIDKLKATVTTLASQKAEKDIELAALEKEFADVKLNPYGITSIDFSKRQDLSADVLKMEGVLMGLQLAIETFEEDSTSVSAA